MRIKKNYARIKMRVAARLRLASNVCFAIRGSVSGKREKKGEREREGCWVSLLFRIGFQNIRGVYIYIYIVFIYISLTYISYNAKVQAVVESAYYEKECNRATHTQYSVPSFSFFVSFGLLHLSSLSLSIFGMQRKPR